jgi:citrate synthase
MLIKSMYGEAVERMLQSEEAARRLGVKVETLYAYVSRGLLESHPELTGRRRLFDLADIERLAKRRRGSREVESRLATITTGVTQLRGDGPSYRGRPATELAVDQPFEQVAEWLWQSAGEGDWSAPPLGECPLTQTTDRMRWALVMCGATDPLRADARPESLARAARRVIAALVDAVGRRDDTGSEVESGPDAEGTSIAERLAARLVGGRTSLSATATNAALVLMADHELATSTLAVRVAASVRADIYDALLAGLCTFAGPLHGGASQHAYELLVAAERDGATQALNDALRAQRHLPGFGHMVYTDGDPRFGALIRLVEPLLSEARRDLLHEIMDLADAHQVARCNCDLALAALSWGTGMPTDAGRTIFTIARIAGWTAHYQEELSERPLRFRARAVYSV